MAEFAGFTDQQLFTLAKQKGYTGHAHSDEVNAFIMGNDQARSYVFDMYNQATTLVGRQRRGFAPGGMPLSEMNKYISGSSGDYKDLSTFDNYDFSGAPFTKEEWMAQAKAEGAGSNTQQATDMNKKFGSTVAGATTFTPDPVTTNTTANTDTNTNTNTDTDTTTEVKTKPVQNYSGLGTGTNVSLINASESDPTLIDQGTGQITGSVNKPDIGDIKTPDQVDEDKNLDASQVKDVVTTEDDVKKVTDSLNAQQGTVSEDAQAEGQTMDKKDLGQLGLDAAQIDEAQKVKDPTKRTVQDGELVQSAYDKDKADEVIKKTEAAFATATPSEKATVQGQLSDLMSDFDRVDRTPPWAAGAMRTALAALNARGLSGSSLAGQAIVQAAMESALPIARADATTQASFEMKNLSNRQEAVMRAAEQRATFLGQEFNMEFQARVKNATTISEIAKQNYDADVQIALENARMAQSVDIANLNAENAKVLSDAAALTKLDITNLTNKQQAEVANAQAFLAMDLKNLDNKQQTAIFKAEAKIQALFKDQTAENAAKQFNAEQKNQVDMFIENLIGQAERFNAEQVNAMNTVQFQEDAANEKFFASLKEQRAQFNANQSLVVSQANAKWYQDVTTANNAAVNAANMNDANNATALTKMQLEQEFQADRDLMNWAFTADDNDKQRAASVMIAKMDADAEQANARGGIMQSLISGFVSAINPLAPK